MRQRGPSDPLNRHRRRFGEGRWRGRDKTMNMNSGDQSDAVAVQEMASFDVRHLSEQQLAALGVSRIAYVKPVMVNGVQGFAIHAADGTPMAVAGDRDVAVAAVAQHEMLAVSVH
jgi:hypothetical protein